MKPSDRTPGGPARRWEWACTRSAIRDPAITEEFAAPRVAVDVAESHVYAADWRPGRVDFLIDGAHVKTVDQAPDYPMQMMVAVFDFPGNAAPAALPDHVPQLAVDFVRARPVERHSD